MKYQFRKSIFFLFFIFIAFITNCTELYCQSTFPNQDSFQNIIGVYKSPKQDYNFTSESISLNADSTFDYIIKTEFTKIKDSGYWRKSGNNLILNSRDKKEKMYVEEKRNLFDKIKFDVTYKDNDPLNYQLYLISKKDTLHIEDAFGDTILNHTKFTFEAFYIIDSRGFKYPTYFLKKRKSNYFRIYLEAHRIFDNEIWEIKNGGLQPIGLDGTKMNYWLVKEE